MITFIMSEVKSPADQAFMIELYEKHKKRMFRMVRSIIFEQDYVEDVVQEILLNLYRNVDTLRGLNGFKLDTYIVYTIRNTAFNHNMKMKAEKQHLVFDQDDYMVTLLRTDERVLEDEQERKEKLYRIRAVMQRLPESEQDILIRKYFMRQTDAEIALAYALKAASVRMKLTRIRRKVLTMMRDEGISYEIT